MSSCRNLILEWRGSGHAFGIGGRQDSFWDVEMEEDYELGLVVMVNA